MIPTKSSAQNGISTVDLGWRFRPKHSIKTNHLEGLMNSYSHWKLIITADLGKYIQYNKIKIITVEEVQYSKINNYCSTDLSR